MSTFTLNDGGISGLTGEVLGCFDPLSVGHFLEQRRMTGEGGGEESERWLEMEGKMERDRQIFSFQPPTTWALIGEFRKLIIGTPSR